MLSQNEPFWAISVSPGGVGHSLLELLTVLGGFCNTSSFLVETRQSAFPNYA